MEHSACRINVQGIDELYEQIVSWGIVHPKAPLEAKRWGVREFGIVDVNGNLVWFVERTR